MSKEEKIPEDLGIEIGTKDQAFWTKFKNNSEEIILGSEREIEIQTEIVKFCDKRIAEEKEKMKS